jgi:hypothetical protein
LLAEWRDGTRLTKIGTACDGSLPDVVLLSDAVVVVNGASRPVLLAGNPTSDETFALDPETCVVLMTGASG